MPASVIAAVAALAVSLSAEFALRALAMTRDPTSVTLAYTTLASTAVGLLILWGMIVGNRLAWQWGRLLGVLAAIVLTIVTLAAFSEVRKANSLTPALILGVGFPLLEAVCLYTIFFALGRPSAKRYFRLECPSCGQFTNTANDFLFAQAKCRACRKVW